MISTIASPLDELRNISGPFELNQRQLESFNALKNLLVEGPVLSFPDFSKPFYVDQVRVRECESEGVRVS